MIDLPTPNSVETKLVKPKLTQEQIDEGSKLSKVELIEVIEFLKQKITILEHDKALIQVMLEKILMSSPKPLC